MCGSRDRAVSIPGLANPIDSLLRGENSIDGAKGVSEMIFRNFKSVAYLALTLFTMSFALAQSQKPLTNADVLRMVKAGVPESAIISSIQSTNCNFDLSPDALVVLHRAGVSQKILEVMMARKGQASGSIASTGNGAKSDKPNGPPSPPPGPASTPGTRPTLQQLKARLGKLPDLQVNTSPRIKNSALVNSPMIMTLKMQKLAGNVEAGQILSASGAAPNPGRSMAAGPAQSDRLPQLRQAA